MKRLGLCFLLSGFAALLYETVWMRQLAVVFGTSELATVTVLAAFMGGLAAGSRLGEGLAGSVRVYAALELLVALGALLVTPLVRAAAALSTWALGGLPAPPSAGGWAQPAFFLGAGMLLLAVPTAAMGATLPVLARAVVRRPEEITPSVAALYCLNLVGAVAGTLGTAFVLIPQLGLAATVGVGVAANCLAAALAWTMAPTAPAGRPASVAVPRGPLALAFLTGAVGLAYEVLWTRILSHVVGSSLAAFALMLAACLLGLALGSAAAVRWTRTDRASWLALALSQVGSASLFTLAYWRVGTLELTLPGWQESALLAGALLVPPFIFQGAAFTFLVRLLGTDAAQAAGRAYRWNTLGGLVGSLAAGLVLLPRCGFAGASLLLAGLSLWLALGALVGSRSRAVMMGGSLLVCLAALVNTGAVLKTDASAILRAMPGGGRVQGDIVYSATGPSASVLLARQWGGLTLFNNGLGQASVRLRGAPQVPSSQQWLGLVPAIFCPEARSALVIGLGLGEALDGLPTSVEEVDVVELEPEVVKACAVADSLRRVSGRRGPPRLVNNDARGALRLTSRRYDLVIGQASHPWTAGASHLYTREFLAEIAQHLTPRGVYAQWIGLQSVDERRFRSFAASLVAEFRHVRLFEPVPGLPLFVASRAELVPAPRVVREDLAAAQRLDEDGVRRLAEGFAPISDDLNLFVSPVGAGPPLGVEGLQRLAATLAGPRPGGLDSAYLAFRLQHLGFAEEAARLADGSADPLVKARRLWAAGDQAGAVQALRAERSEAARFLRLKPRLWPAGAASPSGEEFTGEYRAVAEAAASAARGDWPAVAAREQALARLASTHPAYETAVQLRAGARLAAGEADEAVRLLDEALAVAWDPYSLVLRATAARQAGDPAGMWESLRDVVGLLWWSRRRPAAPGRLPALVREVLPASDFEGIAEHLRSLLKSDRVK